MLLLLLTPCPKQQERHNAVCGWIESTQEDSMCRSLILYDANHCILARPHLQSHIHTERAHCDHFFCLTLALLAFAKSSSRRLRKACATFSRATPHVASDQVPAVASILRKRRFSL